ncbi:MAG: hypothetical protein IPM34_06220 [Saprospiraceae bacterium]|nr:hypothetical protein [Saprospiraceae bacterium]
MSFLDKVKAVFIVPETSTSGESKNTTDTSNSSPQPEDINLTDSIQSETVDLSKFVSILSGALEKHNEPGFDYLEFRKALLSIQKLGGMDESAQYKSAFAAAHAMNVDENKLKSTAKKYLQVLEEEYKHFQLTANEYLKTQQANSESEGKRLTALIRDKETLIANLQKELDEHKKELVQINAALGQASAKVESNRIGFMKVYSQLVDQIQKDIQNMEQYLK